MSRVLRVVVGIVLCLAGYWLRERRRVGAWIIFIIAPHNGAWMTI